jgi:hypothetical protein
VAGFPSEQSHIFGKEMNPIIDTFSARGDLAHLALLLWAFAASAALAWLARENASANRRFDAFVRELARFNNTMEGDN